MQFIEDFLRQMQIPTPYASIILLAAVCVLSVAALAFMRINRRLRAELASPTGRAARLHTWSTFAGRSVRAPEGKSARKHLLRVKLYIDHSNFSQYWRTIVEGGAHVDTLDWARLPETVMAAVVSVPIAKDRRSVYCGTNLYVSYNDDAYYDLLINIKNGSEKSPYELKIDVEEIESWRRENKTLIKEIFEALPFRHGFMVFPFQRQSPMGLQNATFRRNGVPPVREKLVDTSLCTDLIADAVADIYDVALVFSADIDLSPAIQLVQNEYNKQVGIVGLKGTATGDLANVCNFSVDLNQNVGGKPRYEGMRSRPDPASSQTAAMK